MCNMVAYYYDWVMEWTAEGLENGNAIITCVKKWIGVQVI